MATLVLWRSKFFLGCGWLPQALPEGGSVVLAERLPAAACALQAKGHLLVDLAWMEACAAAGRWLPAASYVLTVSEAAAWLRQLSGGGLRGRLLLVGRFGDGRVAAAGRALPVMAGGGMLGRDAGVCQAGC
jgi:hypothetical protein